MLRLTAVLLGSVLLAACGAQPDATATTSATPAPAITNGFAGTPLAPYGHDLNRAKHVQNIVNERAKKEAKALDGATGNGH